MHPNVYCLSYLEMQRILFIVYNHLCIIITIYLGRTELKIVTTHFDRAETQLELTLILK